MCDDAVKAYEGDEERKKNEREKYAEVIELVFLDVERYF
jgi:hypothetical protein